MSLTVLAPFLKMSARAYCKLGAVRAMKLNIRLNIIEHCN